LISTLNVSGTTTLNNNTTLLSSLNVVGNIIGSGTALTNLNFNAITNKPDFISASYLNNSMTEERPYPPKTFNSATTTTTTSTEILNVVPSAQFKESITLNTTGITYGSGIYEIYYSSTYAFPNTPIVNFFNKVYSDSISTGNIHFNNSTGYYNYPTVSNYIVNNYFGDWIILKLPSPILLTKFRFYYRSLGTASRTPALWRCYGSNNGINWVEIIKHQMM
jgi:hypothetical protein